MNIRRFGPAARSARLALLFLTGSVCLAHAQTAGTIDGFTFDPSHKALAGAVISVTHESTGSTRTVHSGADGYYRLPALTPGRYRLTAHSDDWPSVTRETIAVSVNQTTRVDVQFEVERVEESVTVQDSVPLVETRHATLGLVIDRRQVLDLPLNGRNFTQLGTLMPGAVATPPGLGGSTGDDTPGGFSTTTGFSVNGQRTQSNNFLLDGSSNNDTFNAGFLLRPPPDAIEEFKILTHSYGAEFGRNSGSVVNVVTRSGSNVVSGSAYEFHRNNTLEARNYFANGKPELDQHQFGLTLGTPIVRNRLFAFGYYDGFRNDKGVTQNVLVPGDAERTGDFSRGGRAIVDPRTGQPFAGNVIPADRIDPVARALLDRWVPSANAERTRYVQSPVRSDDRDQIGVRVDGVLASHRVMGRYLRNETDARNPLGGSDFSPAGTRSRAEGSDVTLTATSFLRANVINAARISVNRFVAFPSTTSGLSPASAGFAGVPSTQPSAIGLPFVLVDGFFSAGDAQQPFARRANTTVHIANDVSGVTGRHAWKVGLDVQRERMELASLNRPNGDFFFDGTFTGSAAADFLLGLPRRYRQGGGDPLKDFSGWLYGVYAQDDLRLSSRVTLNLGLRYELARPFVEAQDRVVSFQPGRQSRVYPNAPPHIVYPGDDGVPRATIRTDTNNVAPRVAAVWDVTGDGRASLRAGYGIFYDAVPGVAVFQNILAPPFNPLTEIDNPPGFADPFGGQAPPFGDPSQGFRTPMLIIGFDPDFTTPYTHHFNLTFQQELRGVYGVEAGYVGSRGRNYPGYLEINPGVVKAGQTVRGARMFPDYGLVRPTYSKFDSWYDALQVSLRRRPSRGLSLLASYTLSKATDYQSAVNIGPDPRPQDGISLEDVKGPALFDARHRVVVSFSYLVPAFDRGPRILRAALDGWQVNGIVQGQSGLPFTVTEPLDIGLRYQINRPNQVCDPNAGAPHRVDRWFDTSCFERLRPVADAGRFGSAPRNSVRGPGFWSTDLSLLKTIALARMHRLQLRLEAFNLFNQTRFGQPVSNIAAPNFGALTSAGDGRVVQVGVKYLF